VEEVTTPWRERLERTALAPVTGTSRAYYAWVAFLLIVIGWGVYAYSRQLQDGLIVTGMRDRISWGLYITTFVFFIGISHAGTLISAILRVSQARWRTPITRMAEFITLVSLICGALFVIIDLGRPDRVLNVIRYGRWQSPIIWDVLAITTYITASTAYLFLPMIPDLALFRDRLAGRVSGWRMWLYNVLSVRWRGTPSQWRSMAAAITTAMILIIPIAVSVHTVVSWIFAMTLREPWNSTIFGAFFVAGAIFSGVAMLIVVMAILRKVYHLEEYITEKHFVYLGYLLATFSLIMVYGNISEFLTTGYKMSEGTEFHFRQLFLGEFAGFYWFYLLGGLVLPGLLILIPWTRNIWGVVTASVLVVAAMWVERYFIVVSGFRVPLMPYEPSAYAPTWVELSVMAAGFALFALLITLFVKIFPIIAVWEVAEDEPTTEPEPAESRFPHGTAPEPAGGAGR
jgi:molybdopterin-containing oxidoreductase family membrane subunit